MKVLNLLLLLVLLVQCKAVKNTSEDSSLDKAIMELFNGNVTTIPNASETYILISQVNKPSMEVPVNALQYGIYDVQKETIIFSEQKYDAKVVWYNDDYILVDSRPGVKSLDQNIDNAMKHYYINVKTLEKLTQKPN